MFGGEKPPGRYNHLHLPINLETLPGGGGGSDAASPLVDPDGKGGGAGADAARDWTKTRVCHPGSGGTFRVPESGEKTRVSAAAVTDCGVRSNATDLGKKKT